MIDILGDLPFELSEVGIDSEAVSLRLPRFFMLSLSG